MALEEEIKNAMAQLLAICDKQLGQAPEKPGYYTSCLIELSVRVDVKTRKTSIWWNLTACSGTWPCYENGGTKLSPVLKGILDKANANDNS